LEDVLSGGKPRINREVYVQLEAGFYLAVGLSWIFSPAIFIAVDLGARAGPGISGLLRQCVIVRR